MGLFGKKVNIEPVPVAPPPPPAISDADLTDASRIMDQWDASLGNSDAIWDCLEVIARRGGFKGQEALMRESVEAAAAAQRRGDHSGGELDEVTQRPWRWWNEATRLAQAGGNNELAGRIYLFAELFKREISPKMRVADMMETGLDPVNADTYRSMATIAVTALATLPRDYLIHDTASGRVNVAEALARAEADSGTTAPPASPAANDDPGPFNKL